MGIIGGLILGFIAAAIIGICQENNNVYKKKKEDKK